MLEVKMDLSGPSASSQNNDQAKKAKISLIKPAPKKGRWEWAQWKWCRIHPNGGPWPGKRSILRTFPPLQAAGLMRAIPEMNRGRNTASADVGGARQTIAPKHVVNPQVATSW